MSDPENMPRWIPNVRYEHVFAIVRVDSHPGVDMEARPEEAITVTRVVREQEIAEAEVGRLNDLNGPKGAHYFWTITRLALRPGKRG